MAFQHKITYITMLGGRLPLHSSRHPSLSTTRSNHYDTAGALVCTQWHIAVNSLQVYWHASNTHTHTHLMALCPGLTRWAGTRKVKPIWILLKQQTVSGSGISWAIYKSAPRSRQITMQAPHHSLFYRLDALPAAQPTVSKHLRHASKYITSCNAT